MTNEEVARATHPYPLMGNANLRVRDHFSRETEPAIVQIPVEKGHQPGL